jgi:DNA-directed RNA polymerase specialized sigma24 family protein
MDDTSEVTDAADSVERTYREHADRLWRALVLFSGDRELANDAVSEAFAQAITRGSSIRNLDRWCGARPSTSRVETSSVEVDTLQRFLTCLPRSPRRPSTSSALAKLTPKQRASVVLHHYAGYSTKESAVIIGSTSGAVGMHLDRDASASENCLEKTMPELNDRLRGIDRLSPPVTPRWEKT